VLPLHLYLYMISSPYVHPLRTPSYHRGRLGFLLRVKLTPSRVHSLIRLFLGAQAVFFLGRFLYHGKILLFSMGNSSLGVVLPRGEVDTVGFDFYLALSSLVPPWVDFC